MRPSTIDSTEGISERPRPPATVAVKPRRSTTSGTAARVPKPPVAPPASSATERAAGDAPISIWGERGRADGPIAFRAVLRAVIEGAEGQGDAPDQMAAAFVFKWTVDGDTNGLAGALAHMAETVNADQWNIAAAARPSVPYRSDYRAAFVDAYLAASVDFRAGTATVGEYLGVPTPAEGPWRTALTALWVMTHAAGATPATASQRTEQPRLVVFHYCVSLGIVSFKRSSGVKVIPPGGSRFLAGLPYTLFTICAGWWGIPWGPIWTLEAIGRNLRGGTDVTDLLAKAA